MSNYTSWPFKEAEKLAKHTEKKKDLIFQMGYGPSGLPHMGTTGEVIRTIFVIKAFQKITGKKTKFIAFSDDMDGLRKVPSNVPNPELLKKNLGVSLYKIPDPFTLHKSFAEHNNQKCIEYLKKAGFENNIDYEYTRSHEMYEKGIFNNILTKIAQNIDKILKIILPTLGKERQKTYCPFLPIDSKTGIVHHELNNWKIENTKLFYEINGEKKETSILNGNCKLQWKIDWAARWMALGVDYEMYGKDLIESAKIGDRFCKALGYTPPQHLMYELFLDENKQKISKSKGNGLELKDWYKYSPKSTLNYFLFPNPKRIRSMFFGVIPKTVDEYIKELKNYKIQPKKDSIIWLMHEEELPNSDFDISFNMLLNLVTVANSKEKKVVWEFLKKYDANLSAEKFPLLDEMVSSAINYYIDFIEPNKKYRIPTKIEKEALLELKNILEKIDKKNSA